MVGDYSRNTLEHNIKTILRESRDVHPDTMLRRIMSAIPVGAYPKGDMPKIVQDAYEEGVEDGIDWQRSPCGEPQPQWIDSLARIAALKAAETPNLSPQGHSHD